MVIVYTVGGVGRFHAQHRWPVRLMPPLPFIGAARLTIGASAPIFGLLGGLMYYSRRGGSSLVRSAVMGYIMSTVVMGILMPGDRQLGARGRLCRRISCREAGSIR